MPDLKVPAMAVLIRFGGCLASHLAAHLWIPQNVVGVDVASGFFKANKAPTSPLLDGLLDAIEGHGVAIGYCRRTTIEIEGLTWRFVAGYGEGCHEDSLF